MKKITSCLLVCLLALCPLARAREGFIPKGVSQGVYDENYQASQPQIQETKPQAGDQAEDSLYLVQTGERGDWVKRAQAALIRLGYLEGGADGIFGQMTLSAIERFQADQGWQVTGALTLEQVNILEDKAAQTQGIQPLRDAPAGDTLVAAEGSRGDEVKQIQSLLFQLGYLEEGPDGIYGSGTAGAVQAFQRAHGLEDTGAVTLDLMRLMQQQLRPDGIVSLSAFINVFNGAELIAGTQVQVEMPQVPAQGGDVLCPVDDYVGLTLTLTPDGGVLAIRVSGVLDGFAEGEASVLNAFNGVLAACGVTNSLEDSRAFLKKVGAYGDALNEEGIGVYTQDGLRFEWLGQGGRVELVITME